LRQRAHARGSPADGESLSGPQASHRRARHAALCPRRSERSVPGARGRGTGARAHRVLMGALDGKVAVITGAATGIGRASALLFAQAGARLVLTDVREDALAPTVEAVRAVNGKVASVIADLARAEQCPAVVAMALATFGRVDVLFNNAGVGTMVVGGTVETIDLEKWDLAQDVNVRAMYLVSRAAVPAMRAAGGGHIVHTGPVSAFRGSASRPSHAYAASKGAVLALTHAMAASFGRD